MAFLNSTARYVHLATLSTGSPAPLARAIEAMRSPKSATPTAILSPSSGMVQKRRFRSDQSIPSPFQICFYLPVFHGTVGLVAEIVRPTDDPELTNRSILEAITLIAGPLDPPPRVDCEILNPGAIVEIDDCDAMTSENIALCLLACLEMIATTAADATIELQVLDTRNLGLG